MMSKLLNISLQKFEKQKKLDKYSELILGCTEYYNNRTLNIKDASAIISALITKLERKIKSLSKRYSGKSMLSRTTWSNKFLLLLWVKNFQTTFHRVKSFK